MIDIVDGWWRKHKQRMIFDMIGDFYGFLVFKITCNKNCLLYFGHYYSSKRRNWKYKKIKMFARWAIAFVLLFGGCSSVLCTVSTRTMIFSPMSQQFFKMLQMRWYASFVVFDMRRIGIWTQKCCKLNARADVRKTEPLIFVSV